MSTPVPQSMMALRAHARGGPEVLVYESAPVPVPGRDEVLVEVHAVAITFAELTWQERGSETGSTGRRSSPATRSPAWSWGRAGRDWGSTWGRGLRSRPVRP